jgi:hypothetical protein
VDPARESQVRQQLNRLITNLADTADAEPGQRAAAARLAGNAHRTLASIDLLQAERLEADHRARRWVVDGLIDAALELDTVAVVQERVDTSAQQETLAMDSDAAGEQLGELGQQLATLDGPIADLRRQNRDDRARADSLREEASQLRREAADMGPAEGYTTFEHSLHLDRQADRIEYEIAQRELELRFILEPEHAVAERRIQQAQYRQENADSARESLADAEQAMSGEARMTRSGVAELGDRIGAALSEIEQTTAGPLSELYDRAGSNLERAASKSKSAATMDRGEGTDAARVESARAYQQLGDMYWAKARGLEQDISLRQRLADNADALGGVPGAGSPLAGLREAHEEAVSQAIAAYGNAQDVLEQVSGRTARGRLETLKANVSMLQSAASGQAVDYSAVASDTPARSGGRSPAPAAPTGGAESPQALADLLGNANGIQALSEFNLSYTHIDFQSSEHQELYATMTDAQRAMLDLEKALQAKFGSGLMDQMGGAGGQGMMGPGGLDPADIGNADISVGEVTGDRGLMTVAAGGQAQEIPLVRIDGRWFMDGTEQFNMLVAMAGSQPMMMDTLKSMGGIAADLTRRVAAGEFSSPQEVMMALGQAMQGQ